MKCQSSPAVWLRHWAAKSPRQVFAAERDRSGGWREVTYSDALKSAEIIAGNLVKRNLSVERPVAIIAEDGVDHALLRIGAMLAGIPVAEIDPLYARANSLAGLLERALMLCQPGLIYIYDGAKDGDTVSQFMAGSAELVASLNAGSSAKTFASLNKKGIFSARRLKGAAPESDAIATICFSGASANVLAGVAASHTDICFEQEAINAIAPHLTETRPIIVGRSSWHQADAGNLIFNLGLRAGGTFYRGDFIAPGSKAAAVLPPPTVHFADSRSFYAMLAHLEVEEAAGRVKEVGFNEVKVIKKSKIIAFLSWFWGPIPWFLEIAVLICIIIG
ncbi:MAG: AMP-binding protein, partial [Rhodospirillales bacterium]|nr:AMP-binding protein [Rhodospirillales bacterium]